MIYSQNAQISFDDGKTWHDATVERSIQPIVDTTCSPRDFNDYLQKTSQAACFTVRIEPSMLGEMCDRVALSQAELTRKLTQFYQEYYGNFVDDTKTEK